MQKEIDQYKIAIDTSFSYYAIAIESGTIPHLAFHNRIQPSDAYIIQGMRKKDTLIRTKNFL
jgi:hypothetical protein